MSPRFRVLIEVVIDAPSLSSAATAVERDLSVELTTKPAGVLLGSSVISAVRLDPRGAAV
jgi:hypothetical protein